VLVGPQLLLPLAAVLLVPELVALLRLLRLVAAAVLAVGPVAQPPQLLLLHLHPEQAVAAVDSVVADSVPVAASVAAAWCDAAVAPSLP